MAIPDFDLRWYIKQGVKGKVKIFYRKVDLRDLKSNVYILYGHGSFQSKKGILGIAPLLEN